MRRPILRFGKGWPESHPAHVPSREYVPTSWHSAASDSSRFPVALLSPASSTVLPHSIPQAAVALGFSRACSRLSSAVAIPHRFSTCLQVHRAWHRDSQIAFHRRGKSRRLASLHSRAEIRARNHTRDRLLMRCPWDDSLGLFTSWQRGAFWVGRGDRACSLRPAAGLSASARRADTPQLNCPARSDTLDAARRHRSRARGTMARRSSHFRSRRCA